ncbi:roundabout homolog 3 [Stigmatopora argus]
MLRYLLNTLLQMNFFTDTIPTTNNSTDVFVNSSLPSLNGSLLEWGNITGSQPRLEDSVPQIIEHPSDLIASKGEAATLNCKAEGRPTPMVEWYKDGERVETDREDPRSHRMLLPSGSLFFLRIVHGRRSKPDEGLYVCVARNYLGEAVSRNATLEVAILRDDFRQTPSDVVVAAGEPAVMECIPPRGHPEPTISWKRNNVLVNDRDERIAIRGGKLMISNTRKSDAGMYVCVGTNMVGEKDSDPAELVVFERPVFTKQPVNQVVLADETVDFFCEVHGDPPPTIRWRREEGELPRGRYAIRTDNSLHLNQVRAEDEGTYSCVSENSVGKAEAAATLQVHVPPQIVVHPRDQITVPGLTVTFLCGTKGNPPPAVFWQKEGSQILLFPIQEQTQQGRFFVSPNGELTIMDVHVEDSGYYICQAISVAGSILTKALLEVQSEPSNHVPPIVRQGPANVTYPPGSTVQLHCHIIGNPIPSIQWEKDGQRILMNDARISLLENGTFQIANLQETDSGVYTCLAASSSGETSWSGVLTVEENAEPSVAQTAESFQLPGPPHKPIVTDVSKNSVSLTWQPNAHEGGSAVTSYIVEAFSESASSTWQTVADMVTMETHTVTGLFPNSIYLFIVRAVNAYGLSDPSPISEPARTQDVNPTEQGVEHKQLQRELSEVVVQLQEPIRPTTSSVRVSWTVDHQSQYVQGYRLFYRPSAGTWVIQDITSPSERSALLTGLLKGTQYEIKIRPYFDEIQGKDSRTVLLQIPEEVPIAPPRAVTVATVKQSNISSIIVSWEPPPTDMQNAIILEYMVWCMNSGKKNQTHNYINKTVGGNTLSTTLKGLMPGVDYQVVVAAVTAAGVGTKSQPLPIFINLGAEQPYLPGVADAGNNSDESNVSLAEQITDVVKRPAFITGIGGACWVILMGFSVWIYCRRKTRKELSNYTASFAYTAAVGFPPVEGSGHSGRPGVLGSSKGNSPWLADSWPTTNLVQSSKEAVIYCTNSNDTAEQYYNEAGISNYLNQTEKYSIGGSSEGAIYSTIDTASEDLYNSTYTQHTSTTPYVSNSIPPFSNQMQSPLHSSEHQVDGHWTSKPENSGAQYARPEHCNGKPKQKMGKAVKTPSITWMETLPPPPLDGVLEQCEQNDDLSENEDMDIGLDEEWCPPLPERTYLMEGCEDSPSSSNHASSPVTSSSLQSTATLTPSPNDETLDNVHRQREGNQLSDRIPVSVPQATSTPHGSLEFDHLQCQRSVHNQGQNEGIISINTLVHSRPSAADNFLAKKQKLHVKKKPSQSVLYRREIQGDLPPPPEPPPEEDNLQRSQRCMEASKVVNGSVSSLEKNEYITGNHQHKGSRQHAKTTQGGEVMLYGGKPSCASRNKMSSDCSTTGSSSSRGSTGSRGNSVTKRKLAKVTCEEK